MLRSSDSMYSSILMLETYNIIIIIITKSGMNSEENMIFVLIFGNLGVKLNRNKIHNFLWI